MSNAENPFTGKWEVAGLYCRFRKDRAWSLIGRDDIHRPVWEFTPERTLPIQAEVCAWAGILEEFTGDRPTSKKEFFYFPAERRLYVDRSCYFAEARCHIHAGGNYRVEWVDENTGWLYSLDDSENEPDDSFFRLNIRKIG